MKLTGKKVQQICDALIDAYPTRDLLRMMVRVELDQNLEEMAGGENQSVAIFNVVSWAERNGCVDDLIIGAHNRTPGNEALKQLAAEWRAQAPSGTEPGTTSPLAGMSKSSGPESVDLFLSYSRKDRDVMHQVQEVLREVGLSVWTDDGLEPGTQSWQDAISESVKQANAMVILLSPNSSQSTWVKNEIGFAQTLSKRIFPVLIAGDAATAVPIGLINAQWVDGRQNLQQALMQDLLPALRRHLMLPETRRVSSLAPVGQEVAVPAAGSPASPEKKGEIIGGTQHRTMYVWIAVAFIVGAVAFFSIERFLFPAQTPTPTPGAMNTTQTQTARPTSLAAASTATTIEAAAMLVLSPTSPSIEVSLPVPTATSAPEPAAKWTETPAPTATPMQRPTLGALSISPPAAGTTKTNPKDGAVYVYVPAGPFTMGSGEGNSMTGDNEKPQTSVNVDGFWIMRTEVTNGQYKRCVEDNQACKEPNNNRWNDDAYVDHPVTDVDWHQANDYARWAGGRLPTEAEWEKACRGADGYIYPWGNYAPTADLANFYSHVGDTTPTGQYSPQGDSPYGLVDMAGNVWEWTSSQYRPYPYNAADGRENPEGESTRTLRGGAWNLGDYRVRCAYRSYFVPVGWYNYFGFRVVTP